MEYTFLLADLRTNAILCDLPVDVDDMSLVLNGIGSFRGTVPLGDSRIKARDPVGNTQKCRTSLYVDRGGVLVWGGIVTTGAYDSDTRLLTLGAHEFEWYYSRRRVAEDRTYTDQDQLAVVRDLIGTYAKSKIGGDIGVQVGGETSGVNVTQAFKGYEKQEILQYVQTLAATTTGFDFAIDVAYDSNGHPAKYLHLGYPRRGRPTSQSGLMFEFPGNILRYTWPEDGTMMATTLYGAGAGSGATMLQSTASAPSQIDAGWPLLEDTVSNKVVTQQGVLNVYTAAALQGRENPPQTIEVTVRADADPVLGSYITGDEARFRITDERYPNTLDTYFRIIAIKPQPAVPGKAEQVTLTLGPTL